MTGRVRPIRYGVTAFVIFITVLLGISIARAQEAGGGESAVDIGLFFAVGAGLILLTVIASIVLALRSRREKERVQRLMDEIQQHD